MGSPDYSVVYFDPRATNLFDGQLDALKLMNTDLSVPNIYVETPIGTKNSIKAYPYITDTTYIIPLGLKINQSGEIIFKILDLEGAFVEMKISLTDKMTGTEQDLLNSQEYKISLPVGEYQNRFFLNLSNTVTDIPDNTPLSDLYTIYYSQGVLKANITNLEGGEGTLLVCNILGQIFLTDKIYTEGNHEISRHLKDGVYITVFTSGNTRIAKKILIIN